MKIGIAQLNATVGDIKGNQEKILSSIRESEKKGCQLTIFPELSLTGYPPEDLVLKPAFIEENKRALLALARSVQHSAAVVGFIDETKKGRFNSAAWIERGRIQTIYHKKYLPNYGVFDEARYFDPGEKFILRSYKNVRFALTICEDLWTDPINYKSLKSLRPDLILNLSASPFHMEKMSQRMSVFKRASKNLNKPILYCNMVGGQDELIFDGGSFFAAPKGATKLIAPQFKEGVYDISVSFKKKKFNFHQQQKPKVQDSLDEIYSALVLGIRDYVQKNKFNVVTLGISGGIDSALVAALAVKALGPERVIGVTMPSQFNTSETINDSQKLAQNLGIRFLSLPIKDIYSSYEQALAEEFKNRSPNIAEENIQARIRGNLLMALSNKFGWLVLTTGNKSETSTGYCTLYGDMAGGFAVLKDVLKTTVVKLSKRLNQNAGEEIIPNSIIARPPTAELRFEQKDEDSLGSYEDLDRIIIGYVERNHSFKKLVAQTNLKKEYVAKIIGLIDRNEYKRRQAPPGIKISPRAFGRDHRMPITNRYIDL